MGCLGFSHGGSGPAENMKFHHGYMQGLKPKAQVSIGAWMDLASNVAGIIQQHNL